MKTCTFCKDVVDIVNVEGLCEGCIDYVDTQDFNFKVGEYDED